MYARPILVRKILTTLILCAPALTAGAQSGFVERMDSILAARRERLAAKYDTAYIGLPDKKWTVKLRTTAQGTDLNTKGTLEGMAFSSMLKTDISATVGANISYRGLTLGFSINPAKLYGKNKDNTFTLSSYGNRMGIDLSYSSANTFSGKAEYGGEKRRIAAGTHSTAASSHFRQYSPSRRYKSTVAEHGLPHCRPLPANLPPETARYPAWQTQSFPCSTWP